MSLPAQRKQRRLAHVLSALTPPSASNAAYAPHSRTCQLSLELSRVLSAHAPALCVVACRAAEIADGPEYRAPAFADMLPELSAPGATPERLQHLYDHGFVIVDDFVGSPWIPALRDAGRRVTEALAPEHVYTKIDGSKGYVHRAGKEQEPWAIRGLIHPAWNEPVFAEFHGSPEFTSFVESWCDDWSKEHAVLGGMLLWCNPRRIENGPSWHRDTTWWGTGKSYFAQREVRGEGPEAYSEETERCASLALAPSPLIFSYKYEKSLCGTGCAGRRSPMPTPSHKPGRGGVSACSSPSSTSECASLACLSCVCMSVCLSLACGCLCVCASLCVSHHI